MDQELISDPWPTKIPEMVRDDDDQAQGTGK